MEKNNQGIIILDGGMGTQLQLAGMPVGAHPEIFGIEHPEIVEGIQKRYVDAGSQVLYSNTFEANARKLGPTGVSVKEAVTANVQAAKRVAEKADHPVKVAIDCGPIGELLEPLGTLPFEEAYELFKETMVAGEEAGADLIIVETVADLYEVKAAVLAAKENTSLPLWVTMTFEKNGRTFLGTSVASMAVMLDSLGVDAMGINCSLGPKEILPLIREMRKWTDKPILVKPNAGLPDPKTGEYHITAPEFAEAMEHFLGLGVACVGGCCGTDPTFIKELTATVRRFEEDAKTEARPEKKRAVCSPGRVAEYGKINVIGERINPTGKKRLQQALAEEDMDYIMDLAIQQQEAGADILDINVGAPGIDEARLMPMVIKAVQSVVDLPIQIDATDPAVVEAGLRAVNGRAIINSTDGSEERLSTLLPLAKKYGAAILGLTMDEQGLPETAEDRIRVAEKILARAEEIGIPKEDVIMDCLTLTISAQQSQAKETLKAVRYVSEEMGLHCALGVSNISFGLPAKYHVTEAFLVQALGCGLDFPIIDPNSKVMMDAVAAVRALSGEDESSAAYIARFAPEEAAKKQGTAPKTETKKEDEDPLKLAVTRGLSKEAEAATRELLETMAPMDVINEKIIPILDEVGKQYEAEIIFLPQLINSASAACAGLDLIKARLAEQGGEGLNRGKIILATVKGDIHDIGKNIVKVVLENYGYQIIDLGKDVPAETVVQKAIDEDVYLVGLSALMTTTVSAMADTIKALKASGHDCKIMVGGAVLTEEYALEIGADYYSKDAAQSADIAKKVLG